MQVSLRSILVQRLRALFAVPSLLLFAAPASATWSIVIVDRGTGEVAVGCATCLFGNLRTSVPVIVVGVGAGAAQSLVDTNGVNRQIMYDGFFAGQTPAEILEELTNGAGTQPAQRQYGIAAMSGPAATFSGSLASPAKPMLTGEVGNLSYAIQGNILANDEVVYLAEEAVLATHGDLGQKLLAGMVAAARAGGDGRCSCSPQPIPCGTPPEGFEKSAHAGFMILARVGDPDGPCSANGCAKGSYYMNLNEKGFPGPPDPVASLVVKYQDWRANLAGRPDHLLSRVSTSADRLPANGEAFVRVRVELVDVDGVPLESGGIAVQVSSLDPNGPDVGFGPVQDNGDGSYAFHVRAGVETGETELVITADDGAVEATLYPYPKLRLDAPAALHAGRDHVSLGDPGVVPFSLHQPQAAGGVFLLMASLSGTHPGLRLAGATLPLHADTAFAEVLTSYGRLDEFGRATILWEADPHFLRLLPTRRLAWAALTFDGTLRSTNAVELDLRP